MRLTYILALPQNQPGKPANRGSVYIYGTTEPQPDDKFLDIFNQWNSDGTGGNKRGKLLATQPFDDGQCYQINGGNISTERQQQFPHTANQLMGANLWCQNDIKIPADAPSGKPYTLYWVWDWPTAPNVDPSLPKGKAEIYTTCMDVDITAAKSSRDLEDRAAPAGNIDNMAVPSYLKQLAVAPVQSSQPSAAAQPAAAPVASSPAVAAAPVASSPAAAAVPATSVQPSANAAQPATVTVTVGTPIQAPATQAAAAQANTAASQAPAQVPAAQPNTAASQAPAAPASSQPATQASMPPASLNIAAPVMSPAAGNAAPAASLPTFTGTASAIPSTMMTAPSSAKTQSAAVGARSCPSNGCQAKRSKIFGAAAH